MTSDYYRNKQHIPRVKDVEIKRSTGFDPDFHWTDITVTCADDVVFKFELISDNRLTIREGLD